MKKARSKNYICDSIYVKYLEKANLRRKQIKWLPTSGVGVEINC